jgi:hypothetical protein
MKYPIGTKYKTAGKHPRICTVVDFIRLVNSKDEIVGWHYVSSHEFCGQTVKEYNVPEASVAMGIARMAEVESSQSDGIGNYYASVDKRRKEAQSKLSEARSGNADSKTIASLENKALWAGYTGD